MSLYFISFFAGAVSFLSPCVLPLVPGYICFICGTTLEGLDNQNKLFLKTQELEDSLEKTKHGRRVSRKLEKLYTQTDDVG